MKRNTLYIIMAIILLAAVLSGAYASAQAQEMGRLKDFISYVEEELCRERSSITASWIL